MRQVLIGVVLLVVFGVAPAFGDTVRGGPMPLLTIPVHIRLHSPIYATSITTHPYKATIATFPRAVCSMAISLAHTNNAQGIVLWPGTSSHPGRYTNLTANAQGVAVWSVENSYPGTYTATVNCRLNNASGTAHVNFNVTCFVVMKAAETYASITTNGRRTTCPGD
jgi:hypothetical protein